MASATSLTFRLSRQPYSVLKTEGPPPAWALASPAPGHLASLTRTPLETSVVCATSTVPKHDGAGALPPGVLAHETGWVAMYIDMGVLPFGLVGVLLAALGPLAGASVGIFALSTYNTDWVLIKDADAAAGVAALRAAGHTVLDVLDEEG